MVAKRPDRKLGAGHDTFWAWCDKGELRLQRCGNCGGLSWPAIMACEHCGDTALEWERMSGEGKIVSWCSFEHDYYRGVMPIPYDTILVELAEGPLFISNPDGFTREDIVVDLPVKLTFWDCEDGAGRFKLPVFTRA
ncbi:MAG: hypothetical protein RLZZ136_275 [Pseudomonadota bacterium]|jgi:uncharacterized OB-fold protein